jgi:mono/diheme cytochrome c family protein
MRFKNALLAVAVLIASGATVSFAQESHIGKMQGRATTGKVLYTRFCIGCHGPQGDGNGENATWIDPKPRDFTAATFKCRSTPSGTLPTDQDLYDSITRGFVNSNMPAWKPLTNQNRADLVAYVKSFSAKWQNNKPGTPITIPPETAVKIESILHGRELFQKMECWKCHGPEGHGNGPAAAGLTDSKDNPIRPFNFAVSSRFKCGVTNEDLYRIFMTGLDGTPMPSFSDNLKPEDAWDLVHFLRTLQPMQSKEVEVWNQWRKAQPGPAKQLKPIGPEDAAVQGAMNLQ